MEILKIGDKAPDFKAYNQSGEMVSLSDFAGKKLILYFYPKDNTPGCTAEACNLNENLKFWHESGFEIIGISADSEKSHQNFATKYGLKFNLLSDSEHKILKLYGAWGEKKMYGKVYEGIIRKTFIINEKGIIEEIIEKVDTKSHTQQIIKLLKLK